MILDANLLLYRADARSQFHAGARAWLDGVLAGNERVGLPWQTIGAFLRVSTNPRLYREPLTPGQAWTYIERWLSHPSTWIPPTSERTAAILGGLMTRHNVTADLVPDAQLAALAIEFGVVLYSADTDFARFDELRWVNPLRSR